MKIYTEIVYTWDDNKGELVEESSKSFDYQGEVTLCDTKRYWHHHALADAAGVGNGGDNSWQQAGDSLGNIANDIASTTWSTAETAAKAAQTASANAWSGMQDLGQDFWDKGAEGLSEMWEGTGLDADTVASWTDKAAMADSWMPGKWSADSSWQSKWMMGVDLRKANVGGFDWRDFKSNLYSEYDEWKAGYDTTVDDLSDTLGDTLGDDPIGDIKDQGDKAEDNINENIADINEDIETGIDENTDTLNDMEDTFNSNVADVNVAVDNAQSMINDTANIINQGLDASININNPDSLITNPQGWYDNNIEGLRQGHGKDWYDLAQGHHDEFMEQGAENIGNLFNDYGEILGGVFGGMFNDTVDSLGQAFAQPGVKSRRDTSNAGDPFGNPSETRRLISEKRTFNTAQSLINA